MSGPFLGPRARKAIERDADSVSVSAASAWEIAIRVRAGRLALTAPLHTWTPEELERNGFLMLSVTIDHAAGVASLPDHHYDPFDRLLIVRARREEMTIVTSDAVFEQYGVRVLDARD